MIFLLPFLLASVDACALVFPLCTHDQIQTVALRPKLQQGSQSAAANIQNLLIFSFKRLNAAAAPLKHRNTINNHEILKHI